MAWSQMRDIVVVIGEVRHTDDDIPYASSRVYKFDLDDHDGDEKVVEEFIAYIGRFKDIAHGGQMKSE